MSKLIPPPELRFVGGGDFEQVGQRFRSHFIQLGGLKPHERVLDVGCGVGRMAIPLLDYLNDQGSYEGFDIVRRGVQWCQRHITPRNPRFRFKHADIFNGCYNPRGVYCTANYRFPYPANSFDFVFLTSVFTHMLPGDVESYLAEITRVLKRGGRMFATFFLLDEEARAAIRAGKSQTRFDYRRGDCHLYDDKVAETGVAYEVDVVRRYCERYGFRIARPIAFGSWSGRENPYCYQDIVVAVKEREVRRPFKLRRLLSRLKSGVRSLFRRTTEVDEAAIRNAP